METRVRSSVFRRLRPPLPHSPPDGGAGVEDRLKAELQTGGLALTGRAGLPILVSIRRIAKTDQADGGDKS